MNMRPKEHRRVRVDALRLASRKLEEGCGSCAGAYVDLARRNGASEEEIRRIYTPGVQAAKSVSAPIFIGTSSMGLSRRVQGGRNPDAIIDDDIRSKKQLASVPAFAGAENPELADPFGIDGTTPPVNPITGAPVRTDFYIGQLGYGLWSNCGPCRSA